MHYHPCLPSKKGRWIDGKAQTVALLLSACDMPTLFIMQTFLPSRRRDCSAIFHPTPTLPKPHYPSLRTTFLPPLSKVRCCRPKKFVRLPEGLPPVAQNAAIPPIISKVQPSLAPHHILSSLFKGEVLSDK